VTGIGFNQRYEIEIPFGSKKEFLSTFNCIHIEWLSTHCKHRWGWHFDDNDENVFLTFEDRKDAFNFGMKKFE